MRQVTLTLTLTHTPRLISPLFLMPKTNLSHRLKITLNLPPINSQPPIPPRIYKRLYNHLEKILTASTPGRGTRRGDSTTRTRTPNTKLRGGDPSPADSPLAHKSRTTPSKEKTLAQFRGNATPSKTSRTTRYPPPPSDVFPSWVRPVLRYLCAEVGPSRIGPVVMSGLESIAAPRGKLTDDVWVNANLVSLLGALYMCVWRGVVFYKTQVDAAEYGRGQAKLLQALRKARKEVEMVAKGDEDAWEGWQAVKVKDLDAATLRFNRHGWLQMDWIAGIEDLGKMGVGRADEDGAEEEVEQGDDEPAPGLGQIRRSDTMLQERYDYLSERKRKEYAAWKEGILSRIKELERDTPPNNARDEDAMEIDEE